MMKYRMLALDVDGTLLDSMGMIPPENLAAIEQAKQAGMLVVLATGRGLAEVRPVVTAMAHEGPVVLAGGALVSDPSTGRTLHSALIEAQLATQIVHVLQREQHAVLVLLDPDPYQADYLVIGKDLVTANTQWWFDMIGAQVHYADHPESRFLHQALRVGIVAPETVMPPIVQTLQARFGERILLQHFNALKAENGEDVHLLEVFAQGVTKWSAITWLAAQHNIPLDAVAAIGDHINDMSMVCAAGCGIAMANGVDVVRQAARYVTTSNEEAGVAAAIQNLLTGQWT
jgi:hydroxymethylpyrimidine pyrophosphatase-like HAD family hydrolase